VFEPMLVILAWPVGVFAWVLFDLHRNRERPVEEPTAAPATVTVGSEAVAAT
jgi:cytochrome c oxidase assembly factor CtaG